MIASPKKADWGSYFSIRLEMKHAVTKLRVDDGKAPLLRRVNIGPIVFRKWLDSTKPIRCRL